MTPEQLDLVATTAARAANDANRLAAAFYAQLFSISPETRVLFAPDATRERGELVDELLQLAALAGEFDHFVDRALLLGARHRHDGVRAGDYSSVRVALMAALGAVLGDEFTDDVAAAWSRLYRLLSETMLEGAAAELFAD